MADVKGKFIMLAASLMSAYPDALKAANSALKAATGRDWESLEPEGWYPTGLYNVVMDQYVKASIAGEGALVTLGRRVYPTIKKTVGLPPELKTPLDFLKFEAEGFLMNHRGSDVRPRTFITTKDHLVVVRAPAPGYNQKLYEGVFLGILEMCGITTGKVVMTEGAPTFEYTITW